MKADIIGRVIKISGSKILVKILVDASLNSLNVIGLMTSYISVGSLIGTCLVDGRTLVLTVDEIYDTEAEIIVTTSISGIFDAVTNEFSFGTNSYPMIGEKVYRIPNKVLCQIFSPKSTLTTATIGTYVYDDTVAVGYNPNVLFGKHLGVFGNTGSGKTCTVVSIIQQYIHRNPTKDIKFIILDVNGEYKSAFTDEDVEYIPFPKLRFHHSILNNAEYGRMFRAAEGVQYPALKDCIRNLKSREDKWDLVSLPDELSDWIDKSAPKDRNGNKDTYSKNQLNNNLRTMVLRIDGIIADQELMKVINSTDTSETTDVVLSTGKKVIILDLQVSADCLDIVVYLLFKSLYERKSRRADSTHLSLVLEEAHRYINSNTEESKLGSYYIDKLSREGRKFGIGLMIASQVPSMLQYEVVSQCNSVIMHKITSKRDMEFLRGVLRISNDTFYTQMSALEKQHAIVCGEAFPNDSVVRINDANPLPRSSDPEIQDQEQ